MAVLIPAHSQVRYCFLGTGCGVSCDTMQGVLWLRDDVLFPPFRCARPQARCLAVCVLMLSLPEYLRPALVRSFFTFFTLLCLREAECKVLRA